MIRIAIVEDDLLVQEQLTSYLHRFEFEQGLSCEISLFSDGASFLDAYRPVYDIILMDVQMPHLDGMSAAEILRKSDKDVILIFITNMAQYAIHGYAVQALDYVLKPVPYFAFAQQLQKAVTQLRSRRKTYLTVTINGGFRRVDTATIYYIESCGHYLHIYTEDEVLVTLGSLKNFETKLDPQRFVRCNSGYLVNLAQVIAVKQYEVKVGPHTLLISRPKKKLFLEALTNYLGAENQ